MDIASIEASARELQLRIWEQRGKLWPNEMPGLIDMLEPEVAAKVLGIDFEYHDELGRFGYRGTRFETAGLLDREANKIAVSLRFPSETIRFTGAHEIGHLLLHPGEVKHRDRPIKGLVGEVAVRSPEEREADRFAACFLVPRKPLIASLESTFSIKTPFVFDDTTAFFLRPDDPDSLLRADEGSLDRALAIASCESYRGKHFNSLAKQFRVSTITMAIRLKELELIQE